MTDTAKPRERALALMREAMPLLEQVADGVPAAHLQAAIDAAERAILRQLGNDRLHADTGEPACLPLVADLALVRAIGTAFTMIAVLLARQRTTPADEFAELLGILAAITDEHSAEESLIIACWGAMVRDFATVPGAAE